MTETVERTPAGAILYDRQIITEISEARFRPAGWLHAEPVSGTLGSAGRGNTMYVGNVPRQFVLRHFMRGGLVGKLVRDVYVWNGEDNTRPFAEWRLLAKMAEKGLRVPRPAAARYRRRGLLYTADIITVRIPNVVPLSAASSSASCAASSGCSLPNASTKRCRASPSSSVAAAKACSSVFQLSLLPDISADRTTGLLS